MHTRRWSAPTLRDIEDFFLERYPNEAALLQDRYGHRWRKGKKSTNQYSMSVHLAARLRDLAKEEAVVLGTGRGTVVLQRGHQLVGEEVKKWRR